MNPSYLTFYNSGKLKKIAEQARSMLGSCCICPRKCGVDRLKNEKGFCKSGLKARVYSYMAHQGEEPPISGERGSGTIFFSGCNMACAYCQNHQFSQKEEGREVDDSELARIMLELQGLKCHNINFVTPTHVMPQILSALNIAASKGLTLPLIYNTSGYELAEIIELLEGIVDIYLPDMRYADNDSALKYSQARNYPRYNQEAVKEMHSQVGVAKISANGIIQRGLIIRHLVLPENISGADKIMKFIAEQLSEETYISLMSQYLPCHNSSKFKGLSRRITLEEYEEAQKAMLNYSLHNGWTQEGHGLESMAGINIKPR